MKPPSSTNQLLISKTLPADFVVHARRNDGNLVSPFPLMVTAANDLNVEGTVYP